ncbi:MAG: glucosidase, partial [Acetobacteraceae bacterium]
MSDKLPRLLDTEEGKRLSVATEQGWRRWGTFLSNREWGTVREDYSADGTAWDYLPHDHARSRAYRWGEDGIAGFCDEQQRWCLSLALWNGRDPILKERLFGLTNSEGNHGEDVKELWWNLDGTPTHSLMRMLYRYPQAAFPYERLLEENRRRGVEETEFELIDTGVLDGDRYFDATVEYAKASPDDILMRITLENPGPEAATLHVLPHLWARNTWSWTENAPRPLLRQVADGAVVATYPGMKERRLLIDRAADWLFCENETNVRRLFGAGVPGHFKDAINDAVVNGASDAVNNLHEGTKCAAHVVLSLPAGGNAVLRLRFARTDAAAGFDDFDAIFAQRQTEADVFYAVLQHGIADPDQRLVQRQALAGMLWSQQWYHLDIREWLSGDPAQPPPPASRLHGRNSTWGHLNNADIISMPDTWEYPWYAAWDLAFHAVTFALIDPDFAKSQLVLLMREWYMQPDGQFPAYEWAFGDVNPPVHAWAALRVYRMDAALTGHPDRAFLERVFHKLMLNFTWWVNRKDAEGRNIFQGGFLGLDNIGLFDRSKPLPTGGFINQSDGTAWMAMYTLNLLRMALELAKDDPVYEDIATKFFEHFLYIAAAMTNMGGDGIGLWDEQDQFFYDVLNLPDGSRVPLRVRSLVGLLPLCAVEVLDANMLDRFPEFVKRARWMITHRPDLASLVSRYDQPGKGDHFLLALLRGHRMKALLSRMLDETEFLSGNGIRAVSRYHLAHPYVLEFGGQRFSIGYVPGESNTNVFGGNSNWRGPVWMPINYLLVEALHEFQRYYGDEFRIKCPTGSGRFVSLGEAAAELGRRLTGLLLRGADGRRPVFGDDARLQQ